MFCAYLTIWPSFVLYLCINHLFRLFICLLITHICKITTSVATWALITSIYLPISATSLKLTNPGSPGRQTLGRSAGKSQDWAEVERSTFSVSSAIPENSGLNERVQGNGAPVFISLCSGGHSGAESHISPASSSPPLWLCLLTLPARISLP